jgi:hypothetical protein
MSALLGFEEKYCPKDFSSLYWRDVDAFFRRVSAANESFLGCTTDVVSAKEDPTCFDADDEDDDNHGRSMLTPERANDDSDQAEPEEESVLEIQGRKPAFVNQRVDYIYRSRSTEEISLFEFAKIYRKYGIPERSKPSAEQCFLKEHPGMTLKAGIVLLTVCDRRRPWAAHSLYVVLSRFRRCVYECMCISQ